MTDILGELLLILYISRATINVLSDKTTQHCPVYIYKKTRKKIKELSSVCPVNII